MRQPVGHAIGHLSGYVRAEAPSDEHDAAKVVVLENTHYVVHLRLERYAAGQRVQQVSLLAHARERRRERAVTRGPQVGADLAPESAAGPGAVREDEGRDPAAPLTPRLSKPTTARQHPRGQPRKRSYALWLYYRFHLSHPDIQDLLAERGVRVSYGAARLWCRKFGPAPAAGLRRHGRPAVGKWHLDGVRLKIKGKEHWLWRAVDSKGLVLDLLVQDQRDQHAAGRFLPHVLDGEGQAPRVVTDTLASYPPATRGCCMGRSTGGTGGAQQPRRELPAAGPETGAGAAAVQVPGARAAPPRTVRHPLQPLPLSGRRWDGWISRKYASRS